MMLFIPFGHTADEDPAWLNLLNKQSTANTPLTLLLLREAGQASVKPGTQSCSVLAPNFSPRRTALLQAQLNQLIIEAASRETLSLCIFMNYPELPGRVG